MKYLPDLKNSFTYTRVPNGAEQTGRSSKHGGSIQPPSFFVDRFQVSSVTPVVVEDEVNVDNPAKGIKYDCNWHNWIRVPEERLSDLNRVGSIATWKHSWYEQQRLVHKAKLQREQAKGYLSKLQQVSEAYKEDILEAIAFYYKSLLEEGDYSMERWRKYVADHRNSGSNMSGIGRFSEILTKDSLVRDTWKDMVFFNKNGLRWLVDKLNRHEFIGYLKHEYLILMVRSRPPELTNVNFNGGSMESSSATATFYRQRTGGGGPMSKLDWVVGDKDFREKAFSKLYKLLDEIARTKLHWLDDEGVKFYLDIPEDIVPIDVSNGEKTLAQAIPYGVGYADLGLPGVSKEFSPSLLSGIGSPTVFMNKIFGAMHMRVNQDLTGVKEDENWGGGDNMGVSKALWEGILEYAPEVSNFLTEENALLGWCPKERRLKRLNVTIDSPTHMVSLKTNSIGMFQPYTMIVRRQKKSRALIGSLMTDLLNKGSAWELLKYIDDKDIETRDSINTSHMLEQIEDMQEFKSLDDKFALESDLLDASARGRMNWMPEESSKGFDVSIV